MQIKKLQVIHIFTRRLKEWNKWRMLNKGSISASYPDLVTAKEK